MATREERLAANEVLFREVNERISELRDSYGFDSVSIVCECVNDDSAQRFDVSRAEYESVRADGARFALVPGHEMPDVEKVVERHGAYVVVEKFGAGAEVAEKTDPR